VRGSVGVERGLDTGGCAHLPAPLRVARVSSRPRLSRLRARLVLQGELEVGYDELRKAGGLPEMKRKMGIELAVFEGLSSGKMFAGLAVTRAGILVATMSALSPSLFSTHEAGFMQMT
jgi:hypothetical protein